MPAAEVIELSRETTVATLGEVLLVHFRGTTLPSCTIPMAKGRRAIAERYPRFSFFAVVEPGSPAPDHDTRQAMLRFFEDSAPTMDSLVCAFVAEGFRAAMVRTVVSSILDLMPRSRFRFPRHIVRSIEEAAPLVHEHAPKVDTAALIAAFRELQATPAPR